MAQLAKKKIEVFPSSALFYRSEQLQVMQTDQLKPHGLGDPQIAPDIVCEQLPLIDRVRSQRPERFTVHTRELLRIEILPERRIREVAGAKTNGGRAEGNGFAVGSRGLFIEAVPGDKQRVRPPIVQSGITEHQ